MGHDVLVAVGVVLQLNDADPYAHYDTLVAALRGRCPNVQTRFYKYSQDPHAVYFLRGCDGDDYTNKVYLFPASTVLWSERCDGSAVTYSHDDDGLQDPERLIGAILDAKERVLDALGDALTTLGEDVVVSSPQIIRRTASYE